MLGPASIVTSLKVCALPMFISGKRLACRFCATPVLQRVDSFPSIALVAAPPPLVDAVGTQLARESGTYGASGRAGVVHVELG